MSFRVVANVLRYSEETLARRLILIVLAETAHDDGIAWMDQEEIATKARLSRTHVAEKVREMEAEGVLEIRKAQRGRKRISVYRLVLEGIEEPDYGRLPFALDRPFTTSEVPTSSDGDGVGSTGLTVSDPQGFSETVSLLGVEPPLEPPPLPPRDQILAAWTNAPHLIAHRPTYFADPKARRAVERALRVYPVEAIIAAIENYETCLGSDAYRWSYRWTFVDFLGRGLDKFVPEAEPLRNYRTRATATSGTTADDFAHMPGFDDD